MTTGRRLTSLALLAGFAVILGTAASAQPLQAENATSAAVTKAPSGPTRHFVGIISQIGTDTFTLSSGGSNLTVNISPTTKIFSFVSGTKTVVSFSTLAAGDRVASLGVISGSAMTAKIVAVIPTPKLTRHADSGTVTAVSSTSLSFLSPAPKNSAGVVKFTAKTVFTEKVGGKITKVVSSAVKVGDRITFVGTIDSDGVITAKLVHIIPGSPSK